MSPEDMDWRRLGPKKRGSGERYIVSIHKSRYANSILYEKRKVSYSTYTMYNRIERGNFHFIFFWEKKNVVFFFRLYIFGFLNTPMRNKMENNRILCCIYNLSPESLKIHRV